MMNKKQGFLLFISAILLVVGGIIATLVSHMVSTDYGSTSQETQSVEALYVATAGLQRATYALTTSTVADQISCANITGNIELTSIAFGEGVFTVTGTEVSQSTSLATSINSSDTTIPVTSLTGLANSGRIQIGNEYIIYSGKSTTSAACSGNQPCLLNAVRGASNSSAASHATSSTVEQSRCHIISTAGVPSLTSYEGRRVLSQDVYVGTLGADTGWIAANKNGANEYILSLNGAVWSDAGPSSSLPNKHLYGSYAVNSNHAWVVGQKSDGHTLIYQWNGSTWEYATTTETPNNDLNGIHCVDANDCWAVGDNKTYVHWNGSTWSNGSTNSNVADVRVNAVYCITDNDCWSVGQNNRGSATINFWNGVEWSRDSSSIDNIELYDVSCVATDDCWAVGANKTFLHWNGLAWSNGIANSNIPNKDIRGVSCTTSNNCWAVGIKQGASALIVEWDGAEWSRVTPDSAVPNKNLYAVDCSSSNSCWAVGQGGTITAWNGSAWNDYTASSIANTNLNAISLVSGNGTAGYVANWNEEGS